jgi:hypothetical protein
MSRNARSSWAAMPEHTIGSSIRSYIEQKGDLGHGGKSTTIWFTHIGISVAQ